MRNSWRAEMAAVRAADNAHTANAATLAAADAPACCTSSLHPRCRRKKPAARRDQSSAKGCNHASIFVIEKSAFGCWKNQQRHAAVSENQQLHLTIEFAAVPFVVFAIHWRASRVSYTALPKIEAVDQDFKAEGTCLTM